MHEAISNSVQKLQKHIFKKWFKELEKQKNWEELYHTVQRDEKNQGLILILK